MTLFISHPLSSGCLLSRASGTSPIPGCHLSTASDTCGCSASTGSSCSAVQPSPGAVPWQVTQQQSMFRFSFKKKKSKGKARYKIDFYMSLRFSAMLFGSSLMALCSVFWLASGLLTVLTVHFPLPEEPSRARELPLRLDPLVDDFLR